MKDWMIYEKIQELKRNKLNKSQVSRRLGIDYKTVLKYWDMKPDGFAKTRDQATTAMMMNMMHIKSGEPDTKQSDRLCKCQVSICF